MTPPVAHCVLEKRVDYEDTTQEAFVKGLSKPNVTGR